MKIKRIFFFLSLILTAFSFPSTTQASENAGLFPVKFELQDTEGNQVTEKTFQGKKMLWVYFGYAGCPDVCPITFSRLKTAYESLKELKEQVQVILITVDPKRDTADNLREYVEFFNPEFMGLRGGERATRAAANSFKVIYYQTPQKSAAGAIFAHTDRVFLVDRKGMVRNLFDAKVNSPKLVEDTRKLAEKK